jgi:hypothetical protein
MANHLVPVAFNFADSRHPSFAVLEIPAGRHVGIFQHIKFIGSERMQSIGVDGVVMFNTMRQIRNRLSVRPLRMGHSMSWVAVKGSTPQAVRDSLALRATGAREEIPESDITAAELPGGRYMVVSDRDGLHLTSGEVLARLSALGEVIACFVEEHVMFSSAECWRSGRRVWSVQHDAQRGMEHLTADGELPPTFSSVRDELRGKQEAAGGSKADVDYIWDVPVTLAHQLTGWRHDHVIPGLADDAFEVLERTSTKRPKPQPQSTPWWRRLI